MKMYLMNLRVPSTGEDSNAFSNLGVRFNYTFLVKYLSLVRHVESLFFHTATTTTTPINYCTL